jgi:replicative DNA helicase
MSDGYTLPFNQLKQSALLGHLLINEPFFKMTYTKVKPSYFLSEKLAHIYKLLIKFYESYHSFPTREEFRTSMVIEIMEPAERGLILAYVGKAIMDTQQIRLDAIKPELTEWLHSVILMKGMTEAQSHFNRQQIKECHEKLMVAVKEVQTTSFDRGQAVSFTNYKEYLTKSETERMEALTTGLDILDRCLLKGAPSGGLQKGDTTIVMAPVNIGKTTCLITMATANIIKGKDVFLMTHEGRPEDIRLKILSNVLQCPIDAIFELYRDPAKIAKLELVTAQIEKHLKYIPYNKAGGMTIEEVVPIIRSTQEEWQASHDGKGFDLLVSDYPAILTTELARKGTLQKRNMDQVVYNNYIQLALEYKFHSLLAIQTNREGSKINKHLNGDNRLLMMEDVKESWDPMAEASNVITINRSPQAIQKNLIIYNVAKCRSNTAGVAVYAKSNFANNTTHSNELGGFAYQGVRNAEHIVEELWHLYKNQNIGEMEIERYSQQR